MRLQAGPSCIKKLTTSFQGHLDWSKPIVGQLKLIAPNYQQWVNSAVYRKCLLFDNPLLEAMSYTPWYVVPAFWVPVILYLGYSGFVDTVTCGGEKSVFLELLAKFQSLPVVLMCSS